MRIYKPRASLMGAVLWTLLAAIFLFDIFTPPENVAICMAYTVPIFMSLFEMRPRALFYASLKSGRPRQPLEIALPTKKQKL